jgi:HAMP domain-containing protein
MLTRRTIAFAGLMFALVCLLYAESQVAVKLPLLSDRYASR